MNTNDLNTLLASLAEQKRENIISFSFALLEWMGITPNSDVPGHVGEIRPRLTMPQTQKLKDFLAPAPLTVQPQLYRLSAEGQHIKVRFAVLKKLKKDTISQLVDNDPGLTSYQASIRGIVNVPGRPPYIPQQPYFIHFVTTPAYNKLALVFNQGDQKRLVTFRNRLTKTQFHKILEKWQGIGTRPKPEIADILWKSLDIKEVNKDFYKQIKERFDTLVGFAKTENTGSDEEAIKQFAVRLIGRYIFCWFLKEKGVIPENLLSSFTISGTNGFDKNVLAPLFFKTLNTPVTERENIPMINQILQAQDAIPYLNGGLFDWHPEDVLFEKLDLDAWLETFAKVLEEFDFTVDESSSQYQIVAIDPEMLGRIFENLLASQNPDTEKMANQRKAFGAFYTPREIVDYMVNESLRAHLETQLMPVLPELAGEVAEPAAVYTGLFESLKTNEVAEPTNRVLLADIENKRGRIKDKISKLFAPDCSDNPFDKEETILVRKALSEITVLDPACGSGAFPMGMLLRLMELRQIVGHGHRNSYDLKEEILSRNIFGVDIMPMAVEIARLRAWLSLVLEADYRPADRKNNFGIAALPNLDFKFICANSLIDSGYDAFLEKIQYNATLYRLDGEIQKLENIRNQYFDPRGDKARKTELQHEFLATKQHIKEQISVGTLIKNYNLADFFDKVDDWNPFDDSHPSSFFSPAWMFGIRNGFDVVIGNPPYVRPHKLSNELKVELWKHFSTYEKKADIYVCFIEKGVRLINKSGILTLIVSDGFLRLDSFEKLRKFILKETSINLIVDFENDVFESATVKTCILRLKKPNQSNSEIKTVICGDSSQINNLNFKIIPQSKFVSTYKSIFDLSSDIILNKIKDKLHKGSMNLGESFSICFGVKTGDDEKFLSKNKLDQNYKKLLRGENIDKYRIKFQGEYVNFNPDEMKRHKKTARPGTSERYEQPKILVRDTGGGLRGTYDNENYYVKDVLIVEHASKSATILKKMIGLLNSSLMSFYYDTTFPTLHVQRDELASLPIKSTYLINVAYNTIPDIVDQIIFAKQIDPKADTTALEREVDVLVYKLYELTYDEVKIVDKGFGLSEEEYNRLKLV